MMANVEEGMLGDEPTQVSGEDESSGGYGNPKSVSHLKMVTRQ
jgi:hypothetical protein